MFYKKHIFFCTNKKSEHRGCGYLGGEDAFEFTKQYLKEQQLWGDGSYRASKAGCLGRCEDNPVCVVYPDGIWYTYIDEDDIREIIEKHLLQNIIVERLII